LRIGASGELNCGDVSRRAGVPGCCVQLVCFGDLHGRPSSSSECALTIGSSDRWGCVFGGAKEGVDDRDKSASFVGGATPRRSTSSLEGAVAVPIAVVRLSVAALIFCGYGQMTATAETAASDAPITSVALHRTACLGMCSVYTVELLSDGEVRYNGEEHVKVKGQRKAQISTDEFNFLVTSIRRIGFFALHDRYRFEKDGCPKVWTDNPSVRITVTGAGQRKQVSYYYGCKGLEIFQRIIWLSETIDDVANSAQWVGPETD
jgi:hypothetical protein